MLSNTIGKFKNVLWRNSFMKNVYVLIQLLGLILFFMAFPVGFLLGLILILLGGIMYRKEAKKDKEKKIINKMSILC